jgi:hypothetical protein
MNMALLEGLEFNTIPEKFLRKCCDKPEYPVFLNHVARRTHLILLFAFDIWPSNKSFEISE